MTNHIALLPNPDGSLRLRELSHRVTNKITSTIRAISTKAVESADVAAKAMRFNLVDLLRGSADVHKALRTPRSSSSWEMIVLRKELNKQVVNCIGGLFAGDR